MAGRMAIEKSFDASACSGVMSLVMALFCTDPFR